MEFNTFEDLLRSSFGIEDVMKVKECLCDETGLLSFEKLGIFVGLYQLLP
jgi:hypothetical protein